MAEPTYGLRFFPRPLPACDNLLVVMSDIEMGAGGTQDDFPHSDFLAELFLSYNQPPFSELPVDLVFNGDTFDFLKTACDGTYPRHITADMALGKAETIARAHPRFFEGVSEFLSHRQAPRHVHFVVGNHDAELLFPEVQRYLRGLTRQGRAVHFPGFELDFGAVHIEHGSQLDPMFAMNPDELFVPFDDTEVLNISWGASALLDTVMAVQPLFCFHDRLKPRERVFELLPEMKEYLVGTFWQYWTRDYWRGFFDTQDPTRRLTWSMLKEIIWRFGSNHTDVTMGQALLKRIEEEDRYRLYIVGHEHQPLMRSFGDRRVLQAGCLRNEYMLVDDGQSVRPINKCYVEAYLRQGVPIASGFVEVEPPSPPPGYVPDSIFDIVPTVRTLLAKDKALKAGLDKARAQERKDHKLNPPAK